MGKAEKPKAKEGTPVCRKCGARFQYQRSLVRHLEVEHGPKVYYRCRRCSHKNNRLDNLRYHYRDCHPNNIEEVGDIKGETCEDIENSGRRHDTGGSRRKRSPSPSPPRKVKQPKKEVDVGRKASYNSEDPMRGSSKDDQGRSAKTKSRNDEESSKKRSREEKQTTKKSTRPAPSTVSRAPDSGSEVETPVTPGQVEGPPRALEGSVATQGVLPAPRERKADATPVKEAALEVQGPLPLLTEEDLREMAEIELSPTPMSVWEIEDEPVEEAPRPTRGGKSIR